MIRPVLSGLALLAVVTIAACLGPDGTREETRWYRGNTHAHSLWSDGDGAPELVAAFYAERGDYDFLVLSDHDVLSRGERWFPVTDDGRLTPSRVTALQQRFGTGAVQLREVDGRREMRLVTLDELRARFEVAGEFLFIQGEEVTDHFEGAPVHVNGLNLLDVVPPQGGDSLVATLNNDVSAIIEHGRRTGRPTLAHVNHPNFGWALTWRELAALEDDRFFEVYNGHPGVRNAGDAEHDALETLWDRALTLRLTELDLGLLYGLATDDGHHYHEQAVGRSNPGRGWIVVRATALTAEALLDAMARGDFYASSGVALTDVRADADAYVVDIAAEPGVTYTTRFVGTRRVDGRVGPVGELLAETDVDPARYELRGDELYVRATVVSSRPHPNPSAAGDLETAWCQPVRGAAGR